MTSHSFIGMSRFVFPSPAALRGTLLLRAKNGRQKEKETLSHRHKSRGAANDAFRPRSLFAASQAFNQKGRAQAGLNIEYIGLGISESSKLGGPSKICFLYAMLLTVVVGLADDVLFRMVVLVLPLRVPHPGRNLPKERRVA